jgi:hypothetical protein
MTLEVIHTCAEDFSSIESLYKVFLEEIVNDPLPALVNMGYEFPAGLGYLVNNKSRWTKSSGRIDLLLDSGKIVGVSAVETSSLSTVFGSGGNRCWLLPKYRVHNEITKYLLASNLQWCKDNNLVGMILTFNDYNKWIYTTIKKRVKGQAGALGPVWSTWWNDCVPFERQLNVFNTPQWAVVKPIASIEEVLDSMNNIDREFGIV